MTDTIQKENITSLLNAFEAVSNATIQYTWSIQEEQAHLSALIEGFDKIYQQVLSVGEATHSKLEASESNPADLLASYVIQYNWMEEIKSFLILWRDVIFEYQKALVLKSENKVTLPALTQLQVDSKKAIESTTHDLSTILVKHVQDIAKFSKVLEKQITTWQKQNNPWPTYKGQFEKLKAQTQELQTQNNQLLKVGSDFRKINDAIGQNINGCSIEIQQFKLLAQEAIEYIHTSVAEQKPGKVAAHLEDLESKIETTNHLQVLTETVENTIKNMIDRIQTPVSTDGGLLLFRDISFHRNAEQWLDSEIMPLIYELWEKNENVINSFKIALMNIRNRSLLLANEIKEGKTLKIDQDELCFPLVSFLQKTEKSEVELLKIIGVINQRIKNDFQLSEIYKTDKGFLPIPLQSTINQFRLTQNPWVVKSKNWINKQINLLQRFKSTVEREEALSVSEKIVRFVQSRKAPFNNQQYSSIFLTKGYIGKSFWVGREEELNRFKNIVEQWRLGFRGAIILSGQRFSGRSLFGEYATNLHFYHKTIRLIPNASVKVEGRILNTTYNLGEALEFIRKYSINVQPVVWIDDLEHWSDPNISLSQNVRALRDVIDNYGNRMFFLVTMSNWLLAHLDKTHDIIKIFQAEINLDRMSPEQIKEAILIRHGATHKSLVHQDGEEITPQEFQKMTSRLYRFTEGNIGGTLTRWSNSIHPINDEKVTYEPSIGYSIPDFISPDAALILSTIMIEKRTNEYRLRKLFGSPFKEKYKPIVQRLISVGILKRHMDGWLEINELAVNDVGRLLDQKGYLKFYH